MVKNLSPIQSSPVMFAGNKPTKTQTLIAAAAMTLLPGMGLTASSDASQLAGPPDTVTITSPDSPDALDQKENDALIEQLRQDLAENGIELSDEEFRSLVDNFSRKSLGDDADIDRLLLQREEELKSELDEVVEHELERRFRNLGTLGILFLMTLLGTSATAFSTIYLLQKRKDRKSNHQ